MLRVPATRLREEERDRPEHALAHEQRHDHRRDEPELANRLEQLGSVRERFDEELVRDLEQKLRLPRADHVRHALQRVRVDRQTLCELVC